MKNLFSKTVLFALAIQTTPSFAGFRESEVHVLYEDWSRSLHSAKENQKKYKDAEEYSSDGQYLYSVRDKAVNGDPLVLDPNNSSDDAQAYNKVKAESPNTCAIKNFENLNTALKDKQLYVELAKTFGPKLDLDEVAKSERESQALLYRSKCRPEGVQWYEDFDPKKYKGTKKFHCYMDIYKRVDIRSVYFTVNNLTRLKRVLTNNSKPVEGASAIRITRWDTIIGTPVPEQSRAIWGGKGEKCVMSVEQIKNGLRKLINDEKIEKEDPQSSSNGWKVHNAE